MENKEIAVMVKQNPKILSIIYDDLAQPSVKKVGVALETVFEFSTSFLLPLKLLNEKVKLNFKKRINDYKKKLESIPDEDICEVNAQIGIPLIEKLSYTTNDEIADLFINLLAKASSTKTLNIAHPSFVQLIERLSVDEARIIKYLKNKNVIPCISLLFHEKDNRLCDIIKNGTILHLEIELLIPANVSCYLDNLVSMGILEIDCNKHLPDENIYNLIFRTYEYDDRINEEYKKNDTYSSMDKKKSFYEITRFGKIFINACNSLEK